MLLPHEKKALSYRAHRRQLDSKAIDKTDE